MHLGVLAGPLLLGRAEQPRPSQARNCAQCFVVVLKLTAVLARHQGKQGGVQTELTRGNRVCKDILSTSGPVDWGVLVEPATQSFFTSHASYLQASFNLT